MSSNRRNGTVKNHLKSSTGSFELETPSHCNGTFDPEIELKWETILPDHLEDKITGLYGLGMGLRDISDHFKEMYCSVISAITINEITNCIIPRIKE